MRGFKTFWSAAKSLAGFELLHMVPKDQLFALGGDVTPATKFDSLAADRYSGTPLLNLPNTLRQNHSQEDTQKILIFYSSIGFGHISAAQSIQQEILRRDSTAQVILQDIRAFMNPAWRRIDERLYWFIANHLPESFDTLFRSMQDRGQRISSLSLLPNDYPEEKVLAYLEQQRPDAILATHYGAAQVLGTLRERGKLADIRIGWLHTDFFEGYFPRISKRIDLTFLAHTELESRWVAAGVPRDKVITTGMPMGMSTGSEDPRNVLIRLRLKPGIPTLLLTGGKEGVGDYRAIIDSIARHCRCRLQIIAVCGTNVKRKIELNAFKESLPAQVTLKVMGLLSHNDMMSLMRAASLLITKAGGMTPAEAFTLGIPTILLDVVSGHERENAAAFARMGLAKIAKDPPEAGKIAADFIANPQNSCAMLEAQHGFRRQMKATKIAQFALDHSYSPAPLPTDFGAENGSPVTDIDEALTRINADAPADVELLLSYSTAKSPQRVVIENPFGHLAIRVGDTVYSANYIADRRTDPNFLQHMRLADYLYGVRNPSPSQLHTNTYGMAYGRETIGLRVAGIVEHKKTAMVNEAHRIENEFRQGTLRWDRNDFNCADVVARILNAADYDDANVIDRMGLPGMPLDTFEAARALFEKDLSLHMELVAYRQVPGAQVSYRFSRFPLSLGQPLRSIARILSDAPRDPLELAVSKQVATYFGDRRLLVEDLKALDLSADTSQYHSHLELALLVDLGRLLSAFAILPIEGRGLLKLLPASKEIRLLIDHGKELARRTTENAEAIARYPQGHLLRQRFSELLNDYGQLGWGDLQAGQVLAYLKRLSVFKTEVEQHRTDLVMAREQNKSGASEQGEHQHEREPSGDVFT